MDSIDRASAFSIIVGISGTQLTDEEKRLLSDLKPLGVILFKRNYQHPEQLLCLTSQIRECCDREDVIICTDHEGGRVQRFSEPFTIIPSAEVIGKTDNEYLAEEIGKIISAELLACGINMNLSPVCDINTNPENRVISDRAYGKTADVVMRMSESVMSGLIEGGVLTCAKHFPGHGDTRVDSHEALPKSDKSLKELYERELLPFINITEKGVNALMMAHILFENIDEKFPVSMSSRFVNLVKNEMSFEGIIITDDMEMKAISQMYNVTEACYISISNGVDVVLVCHTADYQRGAFNRIRRYYLDNPQKVEAKLCRMEKFLNTLNKNRQKFDLSVIGCTRHKEIIKEVIELASM
ncbi:MAG: beta-N-acetylhexosaminidase [Deltaproteobacteria bacterium]|nr:beta-N-acetylhexosaminidase [Deltaproteobacteria bacterium]